MASSAAPPSSVVCDEMLQRTQLLCDEATDFQRVVSACVAARHGTWMYSQRDQTWSVHCATCGRTCRAQDHRQNRYDSSLAPCTHRLQTYLLSQNRLSVARGADGTGTPVRTPACAEWELRSTQGCAYAEEAASVLSRRMEFMRSDGAVIARIMKASQGIRDTVM